MENQRLSDLSIRPATSGDIPLILRFIRELAEYEKLLHKVTATESDLLQSLFSENRVAHALLAEIDGVPAGFAIYFFNYSTFLGRPGLYLEDLFVSPDKRHSGIGKMILRHLARIAEEQNCGRFEWAVLDWNKPAIRFYRSIAARPEDDWTVYRLDQEGIRALAGSKS